MSTTDQITERLRELIVYISDSEIAVRDGNIVDLQTLDETVARLCEDIVALPPDQARGIHPLMAEMISSLESLSRALKDLQDDLQKNNPGR